MNTESKLERFAELEFQRNIAHIIVADDNGGIVAFGKYHIKPDSTGYTVATWDRDIHSFSTKRIAMAWCTADKYNQLNMGNEILVLDRKKQALAADIHCRRGVATQGRNEDFYEIVNIKIQHKVSQFNLVNSELEKCIKSAKYLQIRGFNNETARTRVPNAK